MEIGVSKVRKDIAKAYEDLCKERGVKRHDKLYYNLIEPAAQMNRSSSQGDKNESEVVSISIIYRGNYKMYFNDRIKDEDFEILCDALSFHNDMISHLDFSFNEIEEKSCRSLAKVLEGAVKLESLNLQYNKIGPIGCQNILDALTQAREDEEGNSSLVYLNLEGNDVLSEGLMGIDSDDKLFNDKKTKVERFLKNNRDLMELNLNNNKIDEFGIIDVVTQFNSDMNSTALNTLAVNNPYFAGNSQTSAFHIGRMLQSKFCTLEKLSLRTFGLTDEGLATICDHVITKDQQKLRVLDIGANKITFKGCMSLANLLVSPKCSLESIIMNNNRTGYFGARAMANAIEKNRKLVHLDMTHNDITDDGLFLLARSLKKNDSLISLKLYYNHFEERSKREFLDLVQSSNPNRTSHWFLDFTLYKVDDSIQIAYVDNPLPYDIFVSRRYYLNEELN